ncbi:unnamed protein product, partial [Musa acuminata var. zebrina]
WLSSGASSFSSSWSSSTTLCRMGKQHTTLPITAPSQMAGPTRPSRCSLHGKRPAARRGRPPCTCRPGTSWSAKPPSLAHAAAARSPSRSTGRSSRRPISAGWRLARVPPRRGRVGVRRDRRRPRILLWACKAAGRSCAAGASSLTFRNSKDITISGLTSTDSELYHIVIDGCDGVTVQNVKITAPGNSPNTDGIHVQGSSHVTITGASIKTGDDCISVGPGTTNLWIEQVECGPGHGISIGSLGKEYDEEGVENVTVNTAVFTGTENGLRIKTWGRPSQGFVKGVVFEHAVMQNVQNPIIIDQNYCPGDRGCPDQSSGVRISGVTYNDIHGSSASEVAVNFDCSASNPCTGIGLQDIKLTYGNTAAESSCKHADGTASGFVVPPSCL